MQRLFASVLIAATILFGSTFAGMAMFGMSDGMAMGSGTECLNHCIGAIASLSATVPFSLFVAIGFIMLAVFLSVRLTSLEYFNRASHRWRGDIGIFLRHQQLSTIVLRN